MPLYCKINSFFSNEFRLSFALAISLQCPFLTKTSEGGPFGIFTLSFSILDIIIIIIIIIVVVVVVVFVVIVIVIIIGVVVIIIIAIVIIIIIIIIIVIIIIIIILFFFISCAHRLLQLGLVF